MNGQPRDFAHRTAVEVYGAFLEECVVARVGTDRAGRPAETPGSKIDGRPVRLLTISGKGGWSPDAALADRWKEHDNISLLDHLLSVARGALMFWLADAARHRVSETELAAIERIAYAVVCIAFLHDIDKDLGLPRGAQIDVGDVAERMRRYGIDSFLADHGHRISPAAMLNYIEEVESTQAARSRAAADYDRRIAATCPYVELADKLEGTFTDGKPGKGVDGVIESLRDPERWPVLQSPALKQWEKLEIHDHLHVFLLDRFQRALSESCGEIAGRLPLIEIVHDGRLLCVVPREGAGLIKERAIKGFLHELPYGLGFSVNNRLACAFVGGAASWEACCEVMRRTHHWRSFANLLALPKPLAAEHREAVDALFDAAGMQTSWNALDDSAGATAKPALDHPGGDARDLDMEPAHALVFLTITLNHADIKRRSAAPDAGVREQELLTLLQSEGRKPPPLVDAVSATDGRARRALLALWTIAEIWRLAEDNPDEAQDLLNRIVGREGLIALWLEGDDNRVGLADQIDDVSRDIVDALRRRWSAYLTGSATQPFDADAAAKRCVLCNEPVAASRTVSTASRAHGIKASAFSGRDGRNDHLASPSGDTHLCLVCLAELQLRQQAQEDFKGSGALPPLISSPATTGLFGGLAYQGEQSDVSMGLNDLNRLDVRKGRVYDGLDCQKQRIRLARLETLPNKDGELVVGLRKTLMAIRRLGRPIHIFRGTPRRHPAVFYSDALPEWLTKLLGGSVGGLPGAQGRDSSLRIEQIPEALRSLKLFENIAGRPGLGIEWARQVAYPPTALGALCVAWSAAIDNARGAGRDRAAWSLIEKGTRERALALVKNSGGEPVNVKDSHDPLIRLAWLASRIQKRRSTRDSTNKQLLCWKIALDFYPGAERSTSKDRTALILGLAGTLEEELTRKKDAAAKKHRDDRPLTDACKEFATHFAYDVWDKVFGAKEPTSREQRRAAAIYRFALLEAYRERGIPESETDATDNGTPGDDPPTSLSEEPA